MPNVETMIQRMSDYLDKGRPSVNRIVVNCRRQTVVKFLAPKWRGGPIFYGDREIVTKDPVPCPTPPKPKRKKKGANAVSEQP